jgi:puromycin-sensitive aminopeptidase
MAFDYAVAHIALVNTLVETSTRAGFVAGLGAGSDDPAMPAKINAFATANLPKEARGAATRIVSTMAARRQVDARIRDDVAAWGRTPS